MRRRRNDDDSGGGWSDPGLGAPHAGRDDADSDADSDAATQAADATDATADAAGAGGAPDHPFRAQEDARYEAIDVAGSGGMGTVYVARDQRLGREVALKQIARDLDDPSTARRLAREAWITARLEHPGIVPVHDAGVGPDGRLFYTMRLVRGRSLADALAGAADLPARLTLLRHFLAAAQAIAYAHSRGVVHRDLKPANIMVGEFGETIVVDWGLAGFVDDEAARALGPEADAATVAPTHSAALGTPAYMSPEQAAGARVDRRTDVWGLGAVLHEIITGARVLDVRSPADVVAAAQAGVDLAALRGAGAPAELAAIADKALVADAGGRYADAGELAADVERFLDGRRVNAHAYTSLELLRRLVHAWRVPLTVAALGLTVAVTVFVVTYRRVLRERARAMTAESRTRETFGEARLALGRALEGQAISAHEAGARAEAELFAAHALAITESPDARGVIAAAYAGARPLGAEQARVPGCPRLMPAGPGQALCLGVDDLSLWDLAPPGSAAGAARRWVRPLTVDEALLLHGDRVVALTGDNTSIVLDAHDGAVLATHDGASQLHGIVVDPSGRRYATTDAGREIMVVDLETGGVTEVGRVCGHTLMPAYALAGERLVVVCGNGRVLRVDLDRPVQEVPETFLVPFGVQLAGAYAAAVHPDQRHAAIASIDGLVIVLDLETGAYSPPHRVADGAVHRLAFAGELLLVEADRGGASLWDREHHVELLRLPRAATHRVFGEPGAVVGGGEALWRWRLPERMAPWHFDAPVGLSSATISPDGKLLVTTRGDGRASVWSRADGTLVADLAPTRAVIKRADFSPDGKQLALAIADADLGSIVYDTRTWKAAPHVPALRGVARIFYLADGRLIGIHYGTGFFVWATDGSHEAVEAPRAFDAVPIDAAGTFLMLTSDGRVLRWQDGALVPVLSDVGAHGLAATSDGRIVVTSHDAGVRVHGLGGAPRWLPEPSGDVLDVAVSPDGRWVAAGTRAGIIDLWSLPEGRLTASLRGHRGRSAAMTFAPDGALVTTSWDGTALTWNLAVLDTPAAALVEAAERDWGQDLETALRGRLRRAP